MSSTPLTPLCVNELVIRHPTSSRISRRHPVGTSGEITIANLFKREGKSHRRVWGVFLFGVTEWPRDASDSRRLPHAARPDGPSARYGNPRFGHVKVVVDRTTPTPCALNHQPDISTTSSPISYDEKGTQQSCGLDPRIKDRWSFAYGAGATRRPWIRTRHPSHDPLQGVGPICGLDGC